jgi:hypothetical protein
VKEWIMKRASGLLPAVLMVLAGVASGAEENMPSVMDIIETEGVFAFTDGSSVYTFREDGSFLLEPVGISGRAVEGSWEWQGDGRMEVSGTWTWYNGISSIDDHRSMSLVIWLHSVEPVESECLWQGSDVRLYDIYFIVDRLAPVEE